MHLFQHWLVPEHWDLKSYDGMKVALAGIALAMHCSLYVQFQSIR